MVAAGVMIALRASEWSGRRHLSSSQSPARTPTSEPAGTQKPNHPLEVIKYSTGKLLFQQLVLDTRIIIAEAAST